MNQIINIYTGDIKIDSYNLEIITEPSKYSSKKNNTARLCINGVPVVKNNNYKYEIKCVTCNRISLISNVQMLRKIKNNNIYCYYCRNTKPEKREKQSEFMKNYNPIHKNDKNDIEHIKNKNITNIHDKRINSIKKFNELSEIDKKEFWSKHLTFDEFEKIKFLIKSFENGKVNINDIEYWEIYESLNQQKFTSVLYNKKTDNVLQPNQPVLICENCDCEYRAKNIHKFKKNNKSLCHACSLCRKTFKRRSTVNINNDKIIYQSKLEKKFIDWCNEKRINVINGPKIEYNFNNKTHLYWVDYYIPELKWLIEIKDNHIWHINDIKTGKWNAKKLSVEKNIDSKNYNKFLFIQPNNWEQSLNLIQTRYSLILCESIRS